MHLGILYYREKMGQHMEEAVKLLKEADEFECTATRLYLGMCYEEGKGVDIDLDQAIIWYYLSSYY
jgi:TPR repeat protein